MRIRTYTGKPVETKGVHRETSVNLAHANKADIIKHFSYLIESNKTNLKIIKDYENTIQEQLEELNKKSEFCKLLLKENTELRSLITIDKVNNFETFVKYICYFYDVKLEEMYPQIKKPKYIMARQMIMYFGTIYFKKGPSYVGRFLNRDHASVINGRDKIEDRLQFDKSTIEDVHRHKQWINDNLNEHK